MFKKFKLKQNFNFFFISIVYQKNVIFFFENNNVIKNSQYVYSNNFNILKSLNFFLEIKPISLIDMFSYDSYFFKHIDFVLSKNSNIFYYIYSYKLNSYKYLLMDTSKNHFESLNFFFKNSIWLEREQSEFFGFIFKNSYDCRNLLLEYNMNLNILLKKYDVSENNNVWKTFYEKLEYVDNVYNLI